MRRRCSSPSRCLKNTTSGYTRLVRRQGAAAAAAGRLTANRRDRRQGGCSWFRYLTCGAGERNGPPEDHPYRHGRIRVQAEFENVGTVKNHRPARMRKAMLSQAVRRSSERQVLGKPTPDRPIPATGARRRAPRKALAIGRIVVGRGLHIVQFMKSRRGILDVGACIAGICLRWITRRWRRSLKNGKQIVTLTLAAGHY